MAALAVGVPLMPLEVSVTELLVTACRVTCGPDTPSSSPAPTVGLGKQIWAVRISLPALVGLGQLVSPFLLVLCNCRDRNDLSVTPSSKNISFPISLCLTVHYQQHRLLLSSEVMMPCGLQSRFVAPTLISAYFLQSVFLLVPG